MDSRKAMIFGSVLLGGILVFSLYGIGSSIASSNYGRIDDDEHEKKSYSKKHNLSNAQYSEECGSCHMAYPAHLLPAESWIKMMTELEDHFGENAELDAESRKNIEDYLVNSTGSMNKKYRKMMRNSGNLAPLRITELPYFRHEHNEIPSRFIKGNAKVSSLSQCNACHRNAEKGGFDEDNVVIPGFGRWDD